MSCCYCITRARSITACVDYSFQAKNALSNSVFLHYTFFFLPEEYISSSLHTDVLHTPILYTCSKVLKLRLSPISFSPHKQVVKLRGKMWQPWLGKHQQQSYLFCGCHNQNKLPSVLLSVRFLPQTYCKLKSPRQSVGEQWGTISTF